MGPRHLFPEHATPATWLECLTAGCHMRVDPWDHNTRCAEHRPDPAAPLQVQRHRTMTLPLYRQAS